MRLRGSFNPGLAADALLRASLRPPPISGEQAKPQLANAIADSESVTPLPVASSATRPVEVQRNSANANAARDTATTRAPTAPTANAVTDSAIRPKEPRYAQTRGSHDHGGRRLSLPDRRQRHGAARRVAAASHGASHPGGARIEAGQLTPPIVRRIAHLDMDAFYASVELLRYPELRGQAVVIGGHQQHQPVTRPDGQTLQFSRLRDYAGRGVVTTSTYEARALGVFSGMGVMKSAQLAPDAILLPTDFAAYRHYSQLFKDAVATVAPRIEDRGIDEIYIDLSDVDGDTTVLARRIKMPPYATLPA